MQNMILLFIMLFVAQHSMMADAENGYNTKQAHLSINDFDWPLCKRSDIKQPFPNISGAQILRSIETPDETQNSGSGNALQFDGINDCVDLGMASLNMTNEFTVSFNVRLTSMPAPGKLFSLVSKSSYFATSITDFPFSIIIGDDGKLYALFSKGDDYIRDALVSSPAPLLPNRWYKVSVVYKGGEFAALYLDGFNVQQVAISFFMSSNNQPWFLGRMSQESSDGLQSTQFEGVLDELSIWQSALSETQIRDWMCKKIRADHPLYDKMVAYYHFDETEGTTLADAKGSNNGILLNGPAFIVSGAALGDESSYSYGVSPSTTLAHEQGENMTATANTNAGTQAAVFVYLVRGKPNTTNGTAGVGNNNRYFGVWLAGDATSYNAVYTYSGNPYINNQVETGLRLFSRVDNAASLWTDANAVLNTTNKTLTVTGAHTEYILGSISGILPLQLISLKVSDKDQQAYLSWTIANQHEAAFFQIERSSTGTAFTSLGKVNAKEDNQNSSEYSFADVHPVKGLNYYRLKIVNKSGNWSYSSVVLYATGGSTNRFGSYPNPARSQVVITGLTPSQTAKLELWDEKGQIQKIFQVSSPNALIDISQLPSGIYYIRYFDGRNWQVIRLFHY